MGISGWFQEIYLIIVEVVATGGCFCDKVGGDEVDLCRRLIADIKRESRWTHVQRLPFLSIDRLIT